MSNNFDLLSTVEYGGCSAKLSATKLSQLLSEIPILKDSNVLVDIETHDDAGVYKINDQMALIVTTDFFPPVCSDGYSFGEIAAANSLSDVYAMGGVPLLVLNLNMFPANTIPLEVLRDILLGGQNKINEAGAFTMGGHTIEDNPPKYGLAVVGTVAPDRVITNKGIAAGQKIILTKPLGTGIIIAARRMKMVDEKAYEYALSQMKLLNRVGAELMQKYDVKGATDVTGFGLLGHTVKMAEGSNVTIKIKGDHLPLMPTVAELIDEGCIAGAAFRNKEFTDSSIDYRDGYSVTAKMAALDAQTSGGLLFGVDSDKAEAILKELKDSGLHPYASIIGEAINRDTKSVIFE